jgi:hypothetical protein
MRRAFASTLLTTLLALMLAGCSAGTSDDGTPPNADPNGAQTLPPASSDTPSTGPPDGNSTTSSATATSTGASTTQPPSAGSTSFAAHDEEDTATDEDFPSLLVGGRLQGSGSQLRIEATANNLGERDYLVPDGCRKPWGESMTGPSGQSVQHRQPASSCAGFTYKPLAAHDFLSAALTWDGTVWDSSSGSFVPAPSGSYSWVVTFDVYDDVGGTQQHATLSMSFDVQVP